MNAFAELKAVCPALATLGEEAILALNEAPWVALERLALFGACLIRSLVAFEGLAEPVDATPPTNLNMLSNRGLLPPVLLPFFGLLTQTGSIAHANSATDHLRATLCARLAGRLAVWFAKAYVPHLHPSVATAKDAESVFQTIRDSAPCDAVRRSARKAALRRAVTMVLSE
jgi:hypothetical protein